MRRNRVGGEWRESDGDEREGEGNDGDSVWEGGEVVRE